jgi:hypothetical protein
MDMQRYNAFLKSWGRLISEMTGNIAEVPAPAQKIVAAAVIPAAKVGFPMTR